MVIARRLAGALVEPLSFPLLVIVALVVGGLTVAVRLTWQRRDVSIAHRRALDVALSVAVLGLAVAMSVPGTPVVGLVLLWAILGAEETWAWWLYRSRKSPPAQHVVPGGKPSSSAAETSVQRDEDSPGNVLAELELSPREEIVQQLVRTVLPGGGERLAGWLRVPLEAGQRSANLHLAFCPPFSQAPSVNIDQREGPAARIKPVQVLPFGARFDVKLAQPCETTTAVVLHVCAEAMPPVPVEAIRRSNDPAHV